MTTQADFHVQENGENWKLKAELEKKGLKDN